MANIICNSGAASSGLKNSGFNLKKYRAFKPGFTLIELMVVVLIMAIIGSAGFVMFRTTAIHEANQQNILEQTQNLRAAMYSVSREARMAGNGLVLLGVDRVQIYVPQAIINDRIQDSGQRWFRYVGEEDFGARAIFGTDSGTGAGSDSLTIFRADVETTVPIGRLNTNFTPGLSRSLSLQADVDWGEVVADGDIIAVTNGRDAVILQAAGPESGFNSTIDLGPRFEPAEGHPEGLTFAAGSSVYNLRGITFVSFYVDEDTTRLMADYHDSTADPDNTPSHLVTVANNIEDFQVMYYFFAQGQVNIATPVAGISGDVLANGPSWVQAVDIGMVSKSRNRSEAGGPGSPVELQGHRATSVDDGFTRRVMTEMVQLRNSGL